MRGRSPTPAAAEAPPSNGSGPSRWVFWGAALAVQALLLLVYYVPEAKRPLGDEKLYLRAVESIGTSGTSGLDSLWPPLYAWFLRPWLVVADGAPWAVQGVQIALWLATAWMIGLLTSRWTGRSRAGDLAALLAVVHLPLAAFAHYLWPEVLHLFLMLAAICCFDEAVRRRRAVWMVAAGLLLALCLHTKALLTPFVPLLILGSALLSPRGARGRTTTALLLGLALGLAPSLATGSQPGARSGWFNLWLGLNDSSRHEFVDSIAEEEYRRYLDSARSSEARERLLREKVLDKVAADGVGTVLVRQLGRQYYRLFDKDSFLTIQLPGGRATSGGQGYPATPSWLAGAVRWLCYVGWAVLLAAFALGVALFSFQRYPAGRWVLVFMLGQLALFLLLHVKTRYRLQMLPAMFFFAAYALDRCARRRGEAGGAARYAAGASLAGALLWLAFAADV